MKVRQRQNWDLYKQALEPLVMLWGTEHDAWQVVDGELIYRENLAWQTARLVMQHNMLQYDHLQEFRFPTCKVHVLPKV